MPAKEKEKPRIAITIDQMLLDWIDGKIKSKKFANRSHALEYCVHEAMENEMKQGNAEAPPATLHL
jgi:Arc/MetJ-type ribon-helix-helix transcriptional regulator